MSASTTAAEALGLTGADTDTRRRTDSALAALVETGDLDRLVQLARVVGGAQDALNDDIVGRLAGTAADGLDLLDRVNRSGVARALPAFAALVDSGDLDRLVQLARVVGSAQDALNDDIIGRLADLAGRAIMLLDRVSRSGAIDKLLELAEKEPAIRFFADFVGYLERAGAEAQAPARSRGGIGGLWSLLRQSEHQDTLRFLLSLAGQVRAGCGTYAAAAGPAGTAARHEGA